MSDPQQGDGDRTQIQANRIHAAGGSTVGSDRSVGKTVFAQQNNIFFEQSTTDRWKHARQLVALVSGLAMIGSVVAIVMKTRDLSAAQYTILRVVLALGAAAFAVCIDGFLRVRFKTWLRATGGFAVFVIVYFFQVARPTAATPVPDKPASTTSAITATPVPAAP